MNKEIFLKKCQELIDYENNIFKDLSLFLSNINQDLEKEGLLVILERWWTLPKSGPLLERPHILKRYKNTIDVFFINQQDELEEKGKFLYLSFTLTEYHMGIFGKKHFTKNRIVEFIKEIRFAKDEIQKFGLQVVVNRYKI